MNEISPTLGHSVLFNPTRPHVTLLVQTRSVVILVLSVIVSDRLSEVIWWNCPMRPYIGAHP